MEYFFALWWTQTKTRRDVKTLCRERLRSLPDIRGVPADAARGSHVKKVNRAPQPRPRFLLHATRLAGRQARASACCACGSRPVEAPVDPYHCDVLSAKATYLGYYVLRLPLSVDATRYLPRNFLSHFITRTRLVLLFRTVIIILWGFSLVSLLLSSLLHQESSLLLLSPVQSNI